MTINSMDTSVFNYETTKNKDNVDKILDKLAALHEVDNSSPADLIQYNKQQMDMHEASQRIQNANESYAMMQISDSAMGSLKDNAIELNTQSVERNNAALNSDQKAMIDSQAEALKRSMDDTISQATYNGKPLLGDMSVENLDVTNPDTIADFMTMLDDRRGDIGAAMNATESEIAQYSTRMESLAASMQNKEPDVAEVKNSYDSANIKMEASLFAQSHATDFLQKQVGTLLG